MILLLCKLIYAGPEPTRANDMDFWMTHAPDAGWITQNIDLQPEILKYATAAHFTTDSHHYGINNTKGIKRA